MNVDVPSQPVPASVPAFPSQPMDTSFPPSTAQSHPRSSPTDHTPKRAVSPAPSTSVAKSYIEYSKIVAPVLFIGAGLYLTKSVVSKYLEDRIHENEMEFAKERGRARARAVSSEEPVLPEKEEALAQFVEPPVQRTSPSSDILAPITDVPVRKIYTP